MLATFISAPFAIGDGGIVGPPQIYIYERAQNAIVAWNGNEEVLILSIDIESSESTRVLRVIPLPSSPTEVKEGSFDSFTKLQDIVNEKLRELFNNTHRDGKIGWNSDLSGEAAAPSNIEITFQDIIGAHNITIFHILDGTNFSDYATDFAHLAGLTDITFSVSFQETVEQYMQDNISYFVFDIIDTSEEEHSLNPIVYIFETDFLYYPLKITAASDVGETYAHVNVFCIAKDRIREEVFSDLSFYSNIYYSWYYTDLFNSLNLTENELKEISEDVWDIFKDDPILMSYSYYGQYTNLDGDIIAYEYDFADPEIDWTFPDFDLLIEDTIYVERGATTLLNVTVGNTGNTNIEFRTLEIGGGIDWMQSNWYTITPSYYYEELDVGEEVTFEVLFNIPSNAPLGDYKLNFTITSTNYDMERQKTITMTIYDKTESSGSLYQEMTDLKTSFDSLLVIVVACMLILITLVIVLIIALFTK
jgi:hypothetical protein